MRYKEGNERDILQHCEETSHREQTSNPNLQLKTGKILSEKIVEDRNHISFANYYVPVLITVLDTEQVFN